MEWIRRQNEAIKLFWKDYGSKLFLVLCFLLVGVLCFEAGLLQKSLVEPKPVVIRVAEPVEMPILPDTKGEKREMKTFSTSGEMPVDKVICAFVGSKNSNKYHHPESRCAKQIKPENKRCFASVEEAESKGYIAGCLTP